MSSISNVYDDAQIVSWFLTGLYHETIRLSKKNRKRKKHELLTLNTRISQNNKDEYTEKIDTLASTENIDSEVESCLFFNEVLSLLTPKQTRVIKLIILDGYTEKEVAKGLKISQPAVHKIKKRALKKLKEYLTINPL